MSGRKPHTFLFLPPVDMHFKALLCKQSRRACYSLVCLMQTSDTIGVVNPAPRQRQLPCTVQHGTLSHVHT